MDHISKMGPCTSPAWSRAFVSLYWLCTCVYVCVVNLLLLTAGTYCDETH